MFAGAPQPSEFLYVWIGMSILAHRSVHFYWMLSRMNCNWLRDKNIKESGSQIVFVFAEFY